MSENLFILPILEQALFLSGKMYDTTIVIVVEKHFSDDVKIQNILYADSYNTHLLSFVEFFSRQQRLF